MQQIDIITLFSLLEQLTKAVEQLRETVADEVGGLADYTLECGAWRRAVRIECIRALLRDKLLVEGLYCQPKLIDAEVFRQKLNVMEDIIVGPIHPRFEPSRRKEEPSINA